MSTKFKTRALQDDAEIKELCGIIRDEGVRSYLEIGSKFGGSLWLVAQSMPVRSRVVAIDLPQGTKHWGESRDSLNACVAMLHVKGYDARIIWGNSMDDAVIRTAKEFGPYDAVMIDADHRLPGVTADWNNYASMSNKLVIFHDIAWKRPDDWVGGYRIDVPQLWQSIKKDFRHREILHCATGEDNGIGVLWKN